MVPLGFLFFLLFMVKGLNAVSPNEKLALCSFIASATLPHNWICNNTMSSCSWTGITCTKGNITQIMLNSAHITGTLPTQIGLLNYLQILDLSKNQINGTIPTNLGLLSALQSLKLDNNYLSGTIPTQLGPLSSLTTIALNNNQLCGCFPPNWISQSWNQCDLTGVILQCNCSIPPSCSTSPCNDTCNVCSVFYENSDFTSGCTCPIGYQKASFACEEIDECTLYNCSSGNLNTTCTQPLPNQRLCTCPIGYTIDLTGDSGQSSIVLSGNTSFGGCADINECELYQCQSASLGNMNCTETAINQRKCTCPSGYTVGPNAVAAQPSIELSGNSPFAGCVVIDECALYKCPSNLTVNCAQLDLNQRTCTCPAGYTTTGNPILYQPSLVLYEDTPFAGCTDISECSIYQCNDSSLGNVNCKEYYINQRTCTCPAGYAQGNNSLMTDPSVVLIGNAPFEGCIDINECLVYGCSSGILDDLCSQPIINQRQCTCPAGYTTGSNSSQTQNSIQLFGNTTFAGCIDINECVAYNCFSELLDVDVNCTLPNINQRMCICPVGYTSDSERNSSQSSIVLVGNTTFAGCLDIDECALYKCISRVLDVNCTTPNINMRICTCPGGYTTGATHLSLQPDISLVGSDPFLGCIDIDECLTNTHDCVAPRTCNNTVPYFFCNDCPPGYANVGLTSCRDINECEVYNCSSGDIPTNCTQPPINKRICECPLGYTVGPTSKQTDTTIVLYGNALFRGCIEVNDCLAYGCTDIYSFTNTTCNNFFLHRTCQCEPGYSTQNSTSTVSNITLTPDLTFDGCIEIDECFLYQCVDIASYASTRCKNSINYRTCTCPNGYSAIAPNSTIAAIDLVADAPFEGCFGIADCDVYGCNDTISLLDDVTCVQPQFNMRQCICPPGFTTDKKTYIVAPSIKLVGNATFHGCTDLDECLLYSCSNTTQCSTTPQHPNERDCTCPLGFYPKTSNPSFMTISITGNKPFLGCLETDECAFNGCDDSNSINTTCTHSINQRVCGCPIGYTTGDSDVIAPTITLIGNANFDGCNELNECDVYGCFYLNFNMSCTESGINQRNCTCPQGYTTSTNSSLIFPSSILVGSTPFTLGCYDIDECVAIKPCPSYSFCVNTIGSYECSPCPSGEIGQADKCVDANECLLGTHDCDPVLRPCINLYRTFECHGCPSGYTNETLYFYHQFPVYLTCADIDECNGTHECEKRPCINTIGSYYCGECIPGWEISGKYNCKTICGDGVIINGFEICDTGKFTSIGCLFCDTIEPHWYCSTAGLPCYFDTSFINVDPAHRDIVTVFTNGYGVANKGLNSVTNVLWNDNPNEIFMNFSTNLYCNSTDFNNTLDIIKNVSLQSLGDSFSSTILTTIDNVTGFCNISELFINYPSPPNTWLLPLLVVIAFLLVILIVVGVFIWRRKNYNIILPPELKKFIDFSRVLRHYKKLNLPQVKTSYYYYSIKLKTDSKEEEFLNYLLDKMDFDRNVIIRRAYAVISMVLFQNFSNMRQIQISRFKNDSSKFFKTSWKNNDSNGFRQFTIERFQEKLQLFSWNRNLAITDSPILPVVHGTNKKVAWNIIASGFSALSTNDEGFYGKGIYFSTSMSYIFPYFSVSNHPTVIVCLTIPGNPYPVTEHFHSPKSLMGKPLVSGYQSHYVLTSGSGHPIKAMADDHYDELVIAQESQVVPVFLINVDRSNFEQLKKLCRRGGIKSDISPTDAEKDNDDDFPSSEEDPNAPDPENYHLSPVQSTKELYLNVMARIKSEKREDSELSMKPMKRNSKTVAPSKTNEKGKEKDASTNVSLTYSKIEGLPPTLLINQKVEFTVELRDDQNMPSSDIPSVVISTKNGKDLNLEAVTNDSVHEFQFTPNLEGIHNVVVLANDSQIIKVTVKVLAALAKVANCSVEPHPDDENSLTQAQQNVDTSFLIKVFDKNKKPCSSDEIVISSPEKDNFEHTITQQDTGVYLVTYKFKEAGEFTLHANIGGKDIPGSPFHISSKSFVE